MDCAFWHAISLHAYAPPTWMQLKPVESPGDYLEILVIPSHGWRRGSTRRRCAMSRHETHGIRPNKALQDPFLALACHHTNRSTTPTRSHACHTTPKHSPGFAQPRKGCHRCCHNANSRRLGYLRKMVPFLQRDRRIPTAPRLAGQISNPVADFAFH